MKNVSVSVVIICKNSAQTIGKAVKSCQPLTDDIIVVDSGSTDGTLNIVRSHNAVLIETPWLGYGDTKNLGNKQAKYDWILSLDSDEYIDNTLIESLKQTDLSDPTVIYTIKRISYLGDKAVKHGEWGRGVIRRVFNSRKACWDNSPVHEEIRCEGETREIQLKGAIHHFTSPDIHTYRSKLDRYARLSAEKYAGKKKPSHLFKRFFSPVFNFVQNYIFRAGFLDGKTGLDIARAHAWYTRRKYELLRSYNSGN
ncbi:glycosyltransferase family 2 protein [Filimonas effusa]|uniref:Glycosyltransferase family 2 protein n=1 Tax=Filimonas effusa TaxID=2508721 RepID=A0A4Q1CZW7_9BACT|nr:glycosyltransferase family 2 protein [Filimonas effusa]RXK80943.1 glycosyltransferase family 2 protein [Filimonas effusa]